MNHCRVTLTDAGAGLLRVVSALHARGLVAEHLHLDGTELCVQVRGARAHRLPALLEKVVEVTEVTCVRSCSEARVLPTRYVVLRQELGAAS